MSLIFLADECLPIATVRFMREKGYDIRTIQELGYGGFKDDEVLHLAQTNGWILMTADKDFCDIRIYQGQTETGVIVLKLVPFDIANHLAQIHRILAYFLEVTPSHEFPHHLSIVDNHKYRKRKLLPGAK